LRAEFCHRRVELPETVQFYNGYNFVDTDSDKVVWDELGNPLICLPQLTAIGSRGKQLGGDEMELFKKGFRNGLSKIYSLGEPFCYSVPATDEPKGV